jgi:hypothetical protein
MSRAPARKKLVLPTVLTVTVIGALASGCGDDSKPACTRIDDAGVSQPIACDAGPPDAPIV